MVGNRARTLLDFSQLGKGYIGTPLGRKLAQAKITAKSLSEISGTSKADVSHCFTDALTRLERYGVTRLRKRPWRLRVGETTDISEASE